MVLHEKWKYPSECASSFPFNREKNYLYIYIYPQESFGYEKCHSETWQQWKVLTLHMFFIQKAKLFNTVVKEKESE